jgi:hypothetical protein
LAENAWDIPWLLVHGGAVDLPCALPAINALAREAEIL